MNDETNNKEHDANRDPMTGAPGAHPVGTGVGAASGGAAGAAIGAMGGPVGAAVGLVAGAVAGGLAGKGVAEKLDPTVEEAYWKENYASRPYVTGGSSYEEYQPAYRVGYEGTNRYDDRDFDEVEHELRAQYETTDAKLNWDRARDAARDAWDRRERRRS